MSWQLARRERGEGRVRRVEGLAGAADPFPRVCEAVFLPWVSTYGLWDSAPADAGGSSSLAALPEGATPRRVPRPTEAEGAWISDGEKDSSTLAEVSGPISMHSINFNGFSCCHYGKVSYVLAM